MGKLATGKVATGKVATGQMAARRGTWGGRREGAGRKPKGEQAGASHDRRPRFRPFEPLAVTLRLVPRLRGLRGEKELVLVRKALEIGASDEFDVTGFSVLGPPGRPDQLRLVIEARDEQTLSRGMIGVSVRIARGLNRLRKRTGRVFADRYLVSVPTAPRKTRRR